MYRQGRNEGGKGKTVHRAPNHWGALKSPSNVASALFNTVHLLSKDLTFKHRVAKFVACPRRHLASMCPCVSVPTPRWSLSCKRIPKYAITNIYFPVVWAVFAQLLRAAPSVQWTLSLWWVDVNNERHAEKLWNNPYGWLHTCGYLWQVSKARSSYNDSNASRSR